YCTLFGDPSFLFSSPFASSNQLFVTCSLFPFRTTDFFLYLLSSQSCSPLFFDGCYPTVLGAQLGDSEAFKFCCTVPFSTRLNLLHLAQTNHPTHQHNVLEGFVIFPSIPSEGLRPCCCCWIRIAPVHRKGGYAVPLAILTRNGWTSTFLFALSAQQDTGFCCPLIKKSEGRRKRIRFQFHSGSTLKNQYTYRASIPRSAVRKTTGTNW